MAKKTVRIIENKPGLVTDISDTLNPGYISFKNVFLDQAGKLHKRKGYNTDGTYYLRYLQGEQLGLLGTGYRGFGSDTGVPPLLTDTRYRPNTIYTQTRVNGILDLFYSRFDNRDSKRKISHTLLDPNAATTARYITEDNDTSTEPIQYINTIDHTYIINGGANKTVLKYKPDYVPTIDVNRSQFAKQIAHNLIIRNNALISSVTKEAEITIASSTVRTITQKLTEGEILSITPVGATIGFFASLFDKSGRQQQPLQDPSYTYDFIAGTKSKVVHDITTDPFKPGVWFYALCPVYNTGTTGKVDGNLAYKVDVGTHYSHIYNIYMNAIEPDLFNPFIIGYYIYKSELNDVGALKPKDNCLWYRLDYVDKSTLTIPVSGNILLKADNAEEGDLGSAIVFDVLINGGDGNRNITYPEFSNDFGMKATCGAYTNDRLILGGDPNYPRLLYVSDVNKSDSFDPELQLIIVEASLSNPITAINGVGENVIVFTKTSTTLLRPTDNIDVPYVMQKISTTIGCDNVGSSCVINGVCFFIHNKNLYAVNTNGQINVVSSNVNSQIEMAIGSITVKENPFDMTVRLFYNDINGVRNLVFYTQFNTWVEESGYQDTYTKTTEIYNGKTVLTLNTKQEELKLLGYNYDVVSNVETAISRYGSILIRTNTSNYLDYSTIPYNGYEWDNYIYKDHFVNGAVAYEYYPVVAELIRPLYFPARVKLNAIIIYGSGNMKYSISVDGRAYSTPKTISVNKYGYTIPLGLDGMMFKVKITDENNADIDFDYIEPVYTSQSKVSVKNMSGAGVAE